MVANPAPLMMSAERCCSSFIEAFIHVSLTLIVAWGAPTQEPRTAVGVSDDEAGQRY
jgi:hypothetical protein